MSYMKSRCTNCWATREFESETKSGHLRFIDWVDFEEEFRKDFLPLNTEAAAVNTLETSTYFQGKCSVDDYLDVFKDLIEDSRYTDPKMIVIKFRRGLDCQISTALAGMATGRPSDMDPNAWFHLAVRMDQNCAADEAFQASHKPAYVPLNLKTPSLARGTLPLRFTHSTPTPGNPVPMDIDTARKVRALPDTCRHCGKTGHWAKDCDRCFDIRFMDDGEIHKQIKDRLAAIDVAEVSAEKDDKVPDSIDSEDFVPHSG